MKPDYIWPYGAAKLSTRNSKFQGALYSVKRAQNSAIFMQFMISLVEYVGRFNYFTRHFELYFNLLPVRLKFSLFPCIHLNIY